MLGLQLMPVIIVHLDPSSGPLVVERQVEEC
jgi:hypothetical protein